ncbi:MAG: hypothetical protein HYY24_01730 [Verrucomicrobia bacterium]|nr:hypothetical protein [Verrucomicrobiota bacterium]
MNLMDEEEAAAIREWVRAGGCLYASGASSRVHARGQLLKDFLLADVFGVSLRKADWQEREHYLAPTPAGQRFFADFDARCPAFVKGYGLEVEAHPGAEVLATTTLPWPAPEPTKFSSIHSNPPWVATANPEIVFHRFGRGRVVYCSSVLEGVETLGDTFVKLIRFLHDGYRFTVEAPGVVEATFFHQRDRRRYVLTLVNFQKDLPNIPVDGIKIHLRVPERVRAIQRLPNGAAISHRRRNGAVTFLAPRLHTLAMFAITVG